MSEDKTPTFFIPGCMPEEQEKVYAVMARSCNVHKPGTGQRSYATAITTIAACGFGLAFDLLEGAELLGGPDLDWQGDQYAGLRLISTCLLI
jgi:hypothetical protein